MTTTPYRRISRASRTSKWGNEWTMGDAIAWNVPPAERRAWLVAKYRKEIDFLPWWGTEPRDLAELRGKNLACWCPLEDDHGNRVPCHADVLLELAND